MEVHLKKWRVNMEHLKITRCASSQVDLEAV